MTGWQTLADDRTHIFPLALVDALIDLTSEHGTNEVKGAVMRLFPDPPFAGTPAPPVPSLPARTSDPETSQRAGARHRSSDVGRFSMKSRQAELLRAFFQMEFAGLTATEAAQRVLGYGFKPTAWEGVRRRVSDLKAAGYIEASTRQRPNQGSPDLADVLVITSEGKAAWHRLQESGWSR